MPTCVSLASIAEQCGLNPAGLKGKILVAIISDISAIPAATGLTISTAITMVATKVFSVWEFVIDTGELKIEVAGSGSSKSYTAMIDFNVARHSAAIDAALHDALAAGAKIIAIVPDNNGVNRILGDLERGCDLTYKGSTGKKSGDASGKECVLKVEGLNHPPYYITSAIPIS